RPGRPGGRRLACGPAPGRWRRRSARGGPPARGPGRMVAVRGADRAGWATLAAGLLLLIGVQLPARHVATALYDGVVTEDPYRYLKPPSGALGNPSSATVT